MPDEPAKMPETKAEKAAAVNKALAELYKDHPLDDAKRKLLAERINDILGKNAIGPVNKEGLQASVGKAFEAVLGNPSEAEALTREGQIKNMAAQLEGLVSSRNSITQDVQGVLEKVGRRYEGFKPVIITKRLQVMSDMKGIVAPILKDPETSAADKEAALVKEINESLERATDKNLPTDLEDAAKKMAKDIMATDEQMREGLELAFKGLALTDGPELNLKKNKIKETANTELNIGLSGIATAAAKGTVLKDDEKTEAMTDFQKKMKEALTALGDADIKPDDMEAARQQLKDAVRPTDLGVELAEDDLNAMTQQALEYRDAARKQIEDKSKALDTANEAQRERITADTTARLWPEMMRQEVSEADSMKTLKSSLVDSIKKNATDPLGDEDKAKLDALDEPIKQYRQASGPETAETKKTLADSIANATGGSLFGGMNMGMPTMAAVGGAAVIGLGTELSATTKVMAGIGLVGAALAFENWDKVSSATGLPASLPRKAEEKGATPPK